MKLVKEHELKCFGIEVVAVTDDTEELVAGFCNPADATRFVEEKTWVVIEHSDYHPGFTIQGVCSSLELAEEKAKLVMSHAEWKELKTVPYTWIGPYGRRLEIAEHVVDDPKIPYMG